MIDALLPLVSTLLEIVFYIFTFSYNLGKNIVGAVSYSYQITSYVFENIFLLLKVMIVDFGYFLKDIWNQVSLIYQFLLSGAEEFINFIVTEFEIIYVTYETISYFIRGIFAVVNNFCMKMFELYWDIFEGIKSLFVLFGSGVWFLLTIIPLTIMYINVTLTYYVGRFAQEIWIIIYNMSSKLLSIILNLCNVFHDVPIEATLGVIAFLCMCYVIRRVKLLIYTKIINKVDEASNRWNNMKINYFSKSRQKIAYDENSIHCVVCQDNPKCILILPCKHLCLCTECKNRMPMHLNRCPICRTTIDKTMKVFV